MKTWLGKFSFGYTLEAESREEAEVELKLIAQRNGWDYDMLDIEEYDDPDID